MNFNADLNPFKPHEFSRSLAWEYDQAAMADAFYYDRLGVENVVRFNTGSMRDMDFQRADIDVQLHAKGRIANISEKFRTRNYPDILIELYSLYPDVSGWFRRSLATHLVCFMPDVVHWLPEKELRAAFKLMEEKFRLEEEIKLLVAAFPHKSGRRSTVIDINGKSFDIQVIKAFNSSRNRAYDTISVSLPFSLLSLLGAIRREYRI